MTLKEAIMQFRNGTALIMATMAEEWQSIVIGSASAETDKGKGIMGALSKIFGKKH